MSNRKTKLSVLAFCAQWCAVCRDFKVDFENFAKIKTGLQFTWLDVETSKQWEDEFEIENFPTILLVNQKHEILFLGAIEPNIHAIQKLIEVLSRNENSLKMNTELGQFFTKITTLHAQQTKNYIDLS